MTHFQEYHEPILEDSDVPWLWVCHPARRYLPLPFPEKSFTRFVLARPVVLRLRTRFCNCVRDGWKKNIRPPKPELFPRTIPKSHHNIHTTLGNKRKRQENPFSDDDDTTNPPTKRMRIM